jgi:hypothetical protein
MSFALTRMETYIVKRPNPSLVIGKERCPKCAEKGQDTRGDNLVRYEDGHAHCYGCQHHVPPTGIAAFKDSNAQFEQVVKDYILTLPADAKTTIDYKALNWLDKYGIMRDEIIENDLRWSEFLQSLVFPIRNAGTLLAWTARNFNPNEQHIKWRHSRSEFKNILYILGFKRYPDGPVVLVEDPVSAIKVSRHMRCQCLFGSNIPLPMVARLRSLTKKTYIWLDGDKYKEAISYSQRPRLMGLETQVIFTEKDPKSHTDEEIKGILGL